MQRAKLIARNVAVRGGNTPYCDREWLRHRYEDRRLTLRQIAVEAGCGLRTIARWMLTHQIPTRPSGSNPKPRGAASWTWRGGINTRCPGCGGRKGFAAQMCRSCCPTRGEANPNYRGIANIMGMLRQWTVTDWRPLVFTRDGYACVRCGDKRGGNLEAHHKVSLSKTVERKRAMWPLPLDRPQDRLRFVASLLRDPEITSPENGETLCEECHRSHHRRRFGHRPRQAMP